MDAASGLSGTTKAVLIIGGIIVVAGIIYVVVSSSAPKTPPPPLKPGQPGYVPGVTTYATGTQPIQPGQPGYVAGVTTYAAPPVAASTPASQNPQVTYLVAYNAPNANNNWAAVLGTLKPADLNTLYTYVSQEVAFESGTGVQPTDAQFNAASAIVKQYGLSVSGTFFE